MPVAATISAVAGVGAAAIGASAAKSAAKTQAAAANQATDLQQQIYNQTQANLAPFVSGGTGAQTALQRLLGINADGSPVAATATPPKVGDLNVDAFLKANPDVKIYYDQTPAAQAEGLDFFAKDVAKQQANIRGPAPTYTAADVANWTPPPSATEQALEDTPGFRFARDQGVQSVNRQLGSMGLTGAQAKGISRFVTGLAAGQTYFPTVNALQAATNTGESAAAGAGSIGASQGGNIANTIVGAGTASAAGTVGAANAASAGLSSIPSALIYNKLFNGSGGGGGSGGGSGIYGAGIGATNADFGGG